MTRHADVTARQRSSFFLRNPRERGHGRGVPMRRYGLAFMVAAAAACQATTGDSTNDQQSAATSPNGSITAPAGPTCTGANGLDPRPQLDFGAFQDILGKSQFYAQPQNFG